MPFCALIKSAAIHFARSNMIWNLSHVFVTLSFAWQKGVCWHKRTAAEDVKNNEDVIEAYLGTGLKNK